MADPFTIGPFDTIAGINFNRAPWQLPLIITSYYCGACGSTATQIADASPQLKLAIERTVEPGDRCDWPVIWCAKAVEILSDLGSHHQATATLRLGNGPYGGHSGVDVEIRQANNNLLVRQFIWPAFHETGKTPRETYPYLNLRKIGSKWQFSW